MTEKVKYTALTPITSDSQLRQAVNNLIMNLAPLTGQHSERGNQAVTWLDLINAGYEYSFDADKGFVLPPVEGSEPPDMSTPPALEQFTAVASFNYVTFSWGQPVYKNHSHVEIWRAPAFKTSGSGPNVPTVIGDAVFRLMSPSSVASDTVLPADQWRYWARNVSKTGVAGPWSSIDGTLVSVPEDPAYLIDKISGEIRESDLYKDLGAKIDGSDKGVKSLQQLTNNSYTVKIDSGNAVSGFGIMTDATGRSNFIIRSDKFAIAAPQQYDQAGKPVVNDNAFPFIVDVTNPAVPKTLIKNAYIDQAFIQNLVTGQLVADRITGQTLVGTHIRGGDMAIGSNFNVDTAGSATMLNAFIKGTMQSNNYAAGSAGWQVRYDGYAEFRQAVVRGTIYADSGYFNGTVYAEKMVGGVFMRKVYPSVGSGMSETTSYRTAFTGQVARGMAVPRKLSFSGVICDTFVFCEGYGYNNASTTATYEARLLRDGVLVASTTTAMTAAPVSTGPTGGPTSDSRSGALSVFFIVDVPADGLTHSFEVQYRLVSVVNSSQVIRSYGQTGVVGSGKQTTVEMYIDSGDLA